MSLVTKMCLVVACFFVEVDLFKSVFETQSIALKLFHALGSFGYALVILDVIRMSPIKNKEVTK